MGNGEPPRTKTTEILRLLKRSPARELFSLLKADLPMPQLNET
jgi:hypothetical protein